MLRVHVDGGDKHTHATVQYLSSFIQRGIMNLPRKTHSALFRIIFFSGVTGWEGWNPSRRVPLIVTRVSTAVTRANTFKDSSRARYFPFLPATKSCPLSSGYTRNSIKRSPEATIASSLCLRNYYFIHLRCFNDYYLSN